MDDGESLVVLGTYGEDIANELMEALEKRDIECVAAQHPAGSKGHSINDFTVRVKKKDGAKAVKVMKHLRLEVFYEDKSELKFLTAIASIADEVPAFAKYSLNTKLFIVILFATVLVSVILFGAVYSNTPKSTHP